VLARVAAASVDGVEIQGDIHAPAPYRRHLAQVIVRRALEQALARAK
jgi:CO/xanthine dehydrogenase FAD-binding subunit